MKLKQGRQGRKVDKEVRNEKIGRYSQPKKSPGKDIFLDMLEIELSLPSDRAPRRGIQAFEETSKDSPSTGRANRHIREVMEAEARKQGLQISKFRLAELQPLAGRNPMLARKIIKNEALGLKQDKPEHTQYVVIMPIIIAALMAFGIVRFVGMGTGNKGLYITGGVCLVAGMALKQLGSVKGARKRLG